MASTTCSSQDEGFHVGSLTLQDPLTRKTLTTVEVYSNLEVFIGRDARTCQIHMASPFVSNKHVRIYTVVYDRQDLQNVPPLVFAEDLSMNGTYWNGYLMEREHGSSLISDGDTLEIAGHGQIHFRSAYPATDSQFTELQQMEFEKIRDKYVMTQRVLGSGAFGRVHMAYAAKTGRQFACKVVDLNAMAAQVRGDSGGEKKSKFFSKRPQLFAKRKSTKAKPWNAYAPVLKRIEMQKREAIFLATLSHPNILCAERVFQSTETIFMLTELVTQGDLLSFVRKNGGRLHEDTSALIVRQVLLALEYLHDRGIVHRDVKPDNILVTSLGHGGRIVLADFGCARWIEQPSQRMHSLVGTREYCAPELQPLTERGYNKSVDMWALGCTTAVILVGDTPFNQHNRSYEEALRILEADMETHGISSRPRDFLRRLLILAENQRMDVKQALQHAWFTDPSQAGWFIEMYHDVTASWTPRVAREPITVDLDSTPGPSVSECASSGIGLDTMPAEPRIEDWHHLGGDSTNKVLESSWENLGATGAKPMISTSTSMPKISSHVPLVPKQADREQAVVESEEFEFVSQVKREQLDRPRVERKFLYVSSCDRLHGSRILPKVGSTIHRKSAVAKPIFTVEAANGLENSFPSRQGLLESAAVSRESPPSSKRPRRDDSDDLDQVYEEIFNPVTGKRKRLAYGRGFDVLSWML